MITRVYQLSASDSKLLCGTIVKMIDAEVNSPGRSKKYKHYYCPRRLNWYVEHEMFVSFAGSFLVYFFVRLNVTFHEIIFGRFQVNSI